MKILEIEAARIASHVKGPEHYKNVQDKLKALVEKYGDDVIEAATGWGKATLKQYIRVSVPPMISEKTVDDAEKLLKGM